MKKLLLILICLFVSFEVKSESDDLTGKVLKCKYGEHINILKFTKYDYLPDNFKKTSEKLLKELDIKNGSNLVIRFILGLENDDEIYSVRMDPYRTTLNTIFLESNYRDSKLPEIEISRSKLTSLLLGECEVYEDDIKILLKEIIEDKINNLKSKQKI